MSGSFRALRLTLGGVRYWLIVSSERKARLWAASQPYFHHGDKMPPLGGRRVQGATAETTHPREVLAQAMKNAREHD